MQALLYFKACDSERTSFSFPFCGVVVGISQFNTSTGFSDN